MSRLSYSMVASLWLRQPWLSRKPYRAKMWERLSLPPHMRKVRSGRPSHRTTHHASLTTPASSMEVELSTTTRKRSDVPGQVEYRMERTLIPGGAAGILPMCTVVAMTVFPWGEGFFLPGRRLATTSLPLASAVVAQGVPHRELGQAESKGREEDVPAGLLERASQLEHLPPLPDGQVGDGVGEHGVPLPRGVGQQVALHEGRRSGSLMGGAGTKVRVSVSTQQGRDTTSTRSCKKSSDERLLLLPRHPHLRVAPSRRARGGGAAG